MSDVFCVKFFDVIMCGEVDFFCLLKFMTFVVRRRAQALEGRNSGLFSRRVVCCARNKNVCQWDTRALRTDLNNAGAKEPRQVSELSDNIVSRTKITRSQCVVC